MSNRVLYFGCYNGVGHRLVQPGGRGFYRGGPEKPRLPWEEHELDATLCPGYRGAFKTPDQVQGAAALHHRKDWTALAFWDRSVDARGMSNSCFLIEGTHGFEEAVQRSREAFPEVWRRFQFEVRPAAADGG